MSLPHVTPTNAGVFREATSTVPSQCTVKHDQAVETVVVARERGLARRDAGGEVVEKGPRTEPDDGPDPLDIGVDRRTPKRRSCDCRMQVAL